MFFYLPIILKRLCKTDIRLYIANNNISDKFWNFYRIIKICILPHTIVMVSNLV
jgi:hypothetical protein